MVVNNAKTEIYMSKLPSAEAKKLPIIIPEIDKGNVRNRAALIKALNIRCF